MPKNLSNLSPNAAAPVETARHQQELKLFIFIVVILFPLLSVALIGAYGLLIWIFQIVTRH